jgi:hypothetical protein
LSEDAFCPGDRVRIRAVREVGSARLLDGLTGEVLCPHALARGWYKIRLDPNDVTPHQEWPVPGEGLMLDTEFVIQLLVKCYFA